MSYDEYYRTEEQKENPTAVIHALEAYHKNLRSFKAPKYIMDSSGSSTNSTNNDSGMSSDESQKSAEIAEMPDTIPEHPQVTKQPSTSTAAEGNVSSS